MDKGTLSAGYNSLDSVWSKDINCYSSNQDSDCSFGRISDQFPMAAPTPAAQFTGSEQVGCFSALPSSKPQSSMEEWLRMLTWSRHQVPMSWFVQCRNQEQDLCRHPRCCPRLWAWLLVTSLSAHRDAAAAVAGTYLHWPVLCINQNNFLFEAQKFQCKNCCFYP